MSIADFAKEQFLKTVFGDRAGRLFNGPRPKITVNIGGDDPTRGDMHGYQGIALGLADILGGDVEVLDNAILMGRYPGSVRLHRDEHATAELLRHFDVTGYPDILLDRKFEYRRFLRDHPNAWALHGSDYRLMHTDVHDLCRGRGTGLIISELNELLHMAIARPHSGVLVPHHVTEALLREEGQRFLQAYPNLPRPLIAVQTTNLSCGAELTNEMRSFIEKLAEKTALLPQATLFVNTCHRTDMRGFRLFMEGLHETLAKKDMKSRLCVTTYEMGSAAAQAYNPYLGLLDQADHIIIQGNSRSIVSEALMTGKSVWIDQDPSDQYRHTHKLRLTDVFSDMAPSQPLVTRRVPVVNKTRDIAQALAWKFYKSRATTLGKIILPFCANDASFLRAAP